MSIRNIGKQMGAWGALCGLVLAGVCLSGCRAPAPQQQFAEIPPGLAAPSGADTAPAPDTASAAPTAAVTPGAAPAIPSGPSAVPGLPPTSTTGVQPEVFRVGDSLTVLYSDAPVILPGFEGRIKEDGTITLLQNQTFKADGKTVGELEREIRACYVPRWYKYMTVTVKPVESTRWYYVDGEVRSPSRQNYNSRITVLQAIAASGGFTDFANKKKAKVTRLDGRSLIVNCVKARNDPRLDPELYPGDRIHVPRRLW